MVLLKSTSALPASTAIVKWCTNGPNIRFSQDQSKEIYWSDKWCYHHQVNREEQGRCSPLLYYLPPNIASIVILYFYCDIIFSAVYFRSWWCVCERVMTPDTRMWAWAANQRPVLRSRDQSWSIRGEYCDEASIVGSRVTSGNWATCSQKHL